MRPYGFVGKTVRAGGDNGGKEGAAKDEVGCFAIEKTNCFAIEIVTD